ncbi:DUF1254 domain-containing protein [Rhodococcus spongiicola]|uniref:DUF1254 domain-containing protein n=1 Tax=Rhodococcus spongiicola TaxID=2487352 RepID=A0A3S3ARK0_9NOCA|nr:DUF1254 domain-containing protein [Rhodococcus spongiicola]RVW06770.1 DUF1254 domain-containing protein [Rhodococcus spongiicola]
MTHPSGDSVVGSNSAVSIEAAVRAFVHGFAPVGNRSRVERFATTGVDANSAVSFNSLNHAGGLAGPGDTSASVKNDTICSIAHLDLGAGPLVLDVPDTTAVYFVLQFVDGWTNTFAYIGKRATGTKAGRYVLVPPGWPGELPADATSVHCPTRIVSMVGRWACDGVDDIGRARKLQQQISLTPLFASDSAIGVIDGTGWRVRLRANEIGVPAAAATGVRWDTHGHEAAVTPICTDADGDQLAGDRRYTITFAPTPPVDGFWSITMYSMPHFHLVSNPIERYSIGDRTEGLVYGDDGSLTMTLSATEPSEPTARANWLPTPTGRFRPLLHMYSPNETVFDGSYGIPPIVKSDA